MKRYLVYPIHFDSRPLHLEDENPAWDEQVKHVHRNNKQAILKAVELKFGGDDLQQKANNFRDLGPLPFSIVAYHNHFFQQARDAFVIGAYYPAVTGACSLAERILNHLILDLREDFANTPQYKSVYRKKSFDDWTLAVDVLSAWNVLHRDLPKIFLKLRQLRNASIHFNETTFSDERSHALEILKLLAEIVSLQFGFFRHDGWWAIKGTRGAQFITKAAEADPFLKHYYLPRCPLVGPYYAVTFAKQGTLFLDREFYPNEEITDDEFSELYEARAISDVVPTSFPLRTDVRLAGCLMTDGHYLSATRAPDGVGWIFG